MKLSDYPEPNRWAAFTLEELRSLYANECELLQLGYPIDDKLMREIEAELDRREGKH